MARRRLALVVLPNPVVWEVLVTDRDDFGNPGGVWRDVTDRPDVQAGWLFEDNAFKAPPPPPPRPVDPPAPTVANLKAQLDAIQAQLAQLESREAKP